MQMILKISVLLPVFNAELYIKEAIDSKLNQSLEEFELLIFDDGSTDNTSNIINSYTDKRIIYNRQEINTGYLKLLNEGLEISKGKYIARMDADDIALPNRFEIQYKFLEDNPDVGICGTWCEYFGAKIGENKRPETFEEIKYQLFFGCPITHPTVLMRREFLVRHDLKYDDKYYYAEDHDFFASASDCFRIVNLPQVLLKYRVHATQIGNAKWKEQYLAKSRVQAKIFSKIFKTCSINDKAWLESFFTEISSPSNHWLKQVGAYKKKY